LTFCKIDFAPHWGGEIIVTVKKKFHRAKKEKKHSTGSTGVFARFPAARSAAFSSRSEENGKS